MLKMGTSSLAELQQRPLEGLLKGVHLILNSFLNAVLTIATNKSRIIMAENCLLQSNRQCRITHHSDDPIWIKQQVKKILPKPLLEIHDYWKTFGEWPNLLSPVTFQEKVLHRRIFDRRPVITQMTDKYAVRSYVASRLGPEILPKLYYLTTRPETIPFDQLPDRFVVKPTHGCDWVEIVTDKSTLDRTTLIETCYGWLKRSYYKEMLEWAYKDIKPQIIVEEFIDDGGGTAPTDYKLFVFDGTVRMIQVVTGRFTDRVRTLYSPAWEKLNVLMHFDELTVDVPRPPHLTEMVAAAQKLGDGLDFIRADLYDTGQRIYFGELTWYPCGGLEHFRPKDFGRILGEHWKLVGSRQAWQNRLTGK